MSEVTSSEHHVGERLDKLSQTKRTLHRLGRVAAASALSFGAGSLAMNTIGQTEESIGPFEIKAGLKFSYDSLELGDVAAIPYPTLSGQTRLEGGPLGGAVADTHDFGPAVAVEPTGINLSNIERVVMGGMGMSATKGRGLDAIGQRVETDIEDLIAKKDTMALRSLTTFFGGAAGAHFLLWRRRGLNRAQLTGLATSGSLAVASTAGLAGYDAAALQEPKFQGFAAEARPYAMSVSQLDALDERAMKTIDGFWAFQSIISQQVEQQEAMPPTAMRIMVVSDIHSRNVYPVLKEVVDNNQVDAVIDMGDITDWGSPQEGEFSTAPAASFRELKTGIKDLEVPYYFLPGNHDSTSTERAIAKLPNVTTVPKGNVRVVNIDGLRLAMAGDPLFTPDKSTLEDAEAYALRDELRAKIEDKLRAQADQQKPIDWLTTHQPDVLDDMSIYAPFNSNGHKHYYKLAYDEDNQAWRYQEGSTGGSGLRMAQPSEGDETMPTPDQQQFSIVHIGGDCQVTKIEHFSYNIFNNRDSEYFVEVNDQLVETGEARCGDPAPETTSDSDRSEMAASSDH